MAKRILLAVAVILIIGALNYREILKHFYPVRYEASVTNYAAKYDLDPFLVYSIIRVESKFNPYAKSGKGAMGLMQVTPKTGRYISDLAGDGGYEDERLFDTDTNIKLGSYYLAKLMKDFNYNIECVLAAYNGGEGNVRKWAKIDGDGKITLNVESIPFSETRKYIRKVKKNYNMYKFLYSSSL